LIFDANEAGGEITINSLSVTFYAPFDGDPSLTISLNPSVIPLVFDTTSAGTGIDDAVFTLNAAAITGVQAFFAANPPRDQIQVGAAGNLTNASGGAEAFAGSSVTSVPEPSILALLGAGLLGIGAVARRRSSSASR